MTETFQPHNWPYEKYGPVLILTLEAIENVSCSLSLKMQGERQNAVISN